MRKIEVLNLPKKQSKTDNRETVEEFLARGGEAQKLDYIPPEEVKIVIKCSSTPLTLANMSLAEGAHYFGVINKHKNTPKKKNVKIDVNQLPEHLRHYVEDNSNNGEEV